MNTDELLKQNLEREAAKAAINVLLSDLKRANKAIEESITTFATFRERNQQLERELAEARKQIDKWAYYCGENMKLLKETIATATRAIEQRDGLAEALEMITTHTIADGQCENGYSAAYVAKNALVAVKGQKP
jgi:predicted  nucleic acid-binding Zn-ribbon protein